MLKNMYSIRDIKTSEFLHPFIETNDDTAQRQFYSTMEQIPTMRAHPGDFDLYQIGTFSTANGQIDVPEDSVVQFITTGLDCIKTIQPKGQTNEKTKVGDEAPIQPST